MAFVLGSRHSVAKRERGLYAHQLFSRLSLRTVLKGSYIRLEDGSGLYRTEFREYKTTNGGKTGFPNLRFDGTLVAFDAFLLSAIYLLV